MSKKVISIYLCMLLIATIVLPVYGMNIDIYQKHTECIDYYNLEIEIDYNNLNNFIGPPAVYEIYVGQQLNIILTVNWNPPNATMPICLWAENYTMPAGSTLIPPCHCGLGEVTSIFEWTPAVGQAGIYNITFYLGEACNFPLGSFIIQIIVHASSQDNPPLVVIQSPEDGMTFDHSDIVMTGYAYDDIGLISIGSHHEWIDNETKNSGSIPETTYWPFANTIHLHEGWNRITVFAYDTEHQKGEDQIVVYYVVPPNQPPNKPLKPAGLNFGKLGVSYSYESIVIDDDGDLVYYLFDWDDGTDSGWIGPYNSGEICQKSHIWNNLGSYSVKVKAKDVHDAESVWSEPLPITMPKIYNHNPMLQFLFQIFQRFSSVVKILNQII